MPSPAVSACANVYARPHNCEQGVRGCLMMPDRCKAAQQGSAAISRTPAGIDCMSNAYCKATTSHDNHLGAFNFFPLTCPYDSASATCSHRLATTGCTSNTCRRLHRQLAKRRPAAQCCGWRPRLGRARGCLPAARTAGAAPRPGLSSPCRPGRICGTQLRGVTGTLKDALSWRRSACSRQQGCSLQAQYTAQTLSGGAQRAFSSSGALGWNTDSARTNSPKSMTSFFFVSKTSNTRSVNRLLRCCALNSASANSSLWMRPSCVLRMLGLRFNGRCIWH